MREVVDLATHPHWKRAQRKQQVAAIRRALAMFGQVFGRQIVEFVDIAVSARLLMPHKEVQVAAFVKELAEKRCVAFKVSEARLVVLLQDAIQLHLCLLELYEQDDGLVCA